MTEQQHTPEPWVAGTWDDNWQICSLRGEVIADIRGRNSIVGLLPDKANGARIVACVNACAGLSAEDLKGGVVARETVQDAEIAFKQLAARLESEVRSIASREGYYAIHRESLLAMLRIANNALAALEESKP